MLTSREYSEALCVFIYSYISRIQSALYPKPTLKLQMYMPRYAYTKLRECYPEDMNQRWKWSLVIQPVDVCVGPFSREDFPDMLGDASGTGFCPEMQRGGED